MTSAESQKIQEYFDDYQKKKGWYEEELSYNNNGKAKIASNGPWTRPWDNVLVSESDFKTWFAASTMALASKKAAMESAYTTYNDYKKTIEDRDRLAFATANPTLAKDLETTKAQILANYASNRVKYIAAAAVILVIATVIVYFKFRKKKAA